MKKTAKPSKSAKQPGPKESVTARFDSDQLERLDAMASSCGINRSGLLQIAVKLLLKTGLASTIKALE